MSALAAQQQALLAALWERRSEDAAARLPTFAEDDALAPRGLRAYRSNGRELAARALAGAYPVIAELLGDDNFRPLAHSLWLAHPPRRGDLAQWGGELARHIASLDHLAGEEPYLADLARLEWALHRAATARDAESDIASFELLVHADPGSLTLTLAPGTWCFASAWPLVRIAQARAPCEGEGETALVWRQGFKPCLRAAGAGEAEFIAALRDRRPLADALQAAPELDFDAWLTPAVLCGLVTGAQPL